LSFRAPTIHVLSSPGPPISRPGWREAALAAWILMLRPPEIAPAAFFGRWSKLALTARAREN
jgi:hypothetical protein